MQQTRRALWVGLLAGIPSLSFSQTILGDRAIAEESKRTQAISKHRSQWNSPKLKKVKVKHTPEYEFYKRVEKVAREKQRMLRKMAAPQYSNPLYFGHKRPPKKHIASRMRYCKECGIRH
jgi:hypothetical protein